MDRSSSIQEAANAGDVLRVIENGPKVDMVLLDLFMPGANGFDLLLAVCNRRPDTPVVILSASEEPGHMRKALDFGAMGYIPKSTPPEVMFSALRLIMQGGVYVPPSLFGSTVHPQISPKREQPEQADVEGLTQRQREVLQLLTEGKSNKEIARELNLSLNTVKIHVRDVLRTLGVDNRTKAALRGRPTTPVV
jgi:DNA-binding NarL/FixJ family response regulator